MWRRKGCEFFPPFCCLAGQMAVIADSRTAPNRSLESVLISFEWRIGW